MGYVSDTEKPFEYETVAPYLNIVKYSVASTREYETEDVQMFQKSRKAGQIARTRFWIEEALIAEAGNKPFSEITITRICEKAGVGRQTFYRHFKNKEEVIRSRMRKIFNEYMVSLQDNLIASQDLDFINLQTLQFWKRNANLFRLVNDTAVQVVVFSELDVLMERIVEANLAYHDTDPFLRTFRLWGMKGILLAWAEDGMRQSPEEINAVLRFSERS